VEFYRFGRADRYPRGAAHNHPVLGAVILRRRVRRIGKRFGNCRRRKRPGMPRMVRPSSSTHAAPTSPSRAARRPARRREFGRRHYLGCSADVICSDSRPPCFATMRLTLIALALIERLIRAPWPVHFQMVIGQRRRDVLELADDPPQTVARLAPGGRLSPLVRAVRAAKKIRRPCISALLYALSPREISAVLRRPSAA
jgi:hypothetical protein